MDTAEYTWTKSLWSIKCDETGTCKQVNLSFVASLSFHAHMLTLCPIILSQLPPILPILGDLAMQMFQARESAIHGCSSVGVNHA